MRKMPAVLRLPHLPFAIQISIYFLPMHSVIDMCDPVVRIDNTSCRRFMDCTSAPAGGMDIHRSRCKQACTWPASIASEIRSTHNNAADNCAAPTHCPPRLLRHAKPQ
jgi:hypothetical protein